MLTAEKLRFWEARMVRYVAVHRPVVEARLDSILADPSSKHGFVTAGERRRTVGGGRPSRPSPLYSESDCSNTADER